MYQIKELTGIASAMGHPVAIVATGDGGFSLHFFDRDSEVSRSYDLATARGSMRLFSTLDAAAKVAQQIGAYSLEITLGGIR